MIEHLEFIRYLNAVAAVVAVVAWSGSGSRRWHDFTRRERRVTLWVGSLLIVACYGSLEAAQQEAPVGLRVVLLLISLIGLTGSLLWHPDGDEAQPH